jgi:hypothetical protein
MTQLGADPEDLTVLSRSLRDAAGRLDSLSSGLTRRVRHTRWTGPDAEAVDRGWHSVQRPLMVRCASALRQLAGRVESHRDEQEHASAATAGAAGASTVGGAASPHRGPVVVGSTPARGAPLPPLPQVEDRLRGRVEARVGPVTGAFTGEVTLARLDHGLVRVTVAEAVGAGGALSAGAGVDLAVGGPHGAHGSTQGTAADATARLGAVRRRTWEVPADRVQDLLARVAVERASVATTGQPRPQVVAGSIVDELVERLTGRDPGIDLAAALATAVPEPVSAEALVEVELAAGAAAGVGGMLGLGGRAQANQSARVGTVERDGRHSAVLELDGAGTAAVAGSLLRRAGVSLPGDLHRGATVRLVVTPAAGTHPAQLEVRTRATEGERVHDSVVRLHPTVDGGHAAVARAAQHLTRRDVPAALAALEEVRLDTGRVEVRTGDGTLSGHSARGSGGAGLGVGGGVTLRGQLTRIDRR